MADKSDWVVDGFQFGTEKDAELARNELLRIENIKVKLDYDNIQMVHAVYAKAIENRVFKTPVGYVFLKKLQTALTGSALTQEEVPDIPVQGVYNLRETANPAVEKIKASQKSARKKEKLTKEAVTRRISITANVVLVMLVILMFVISLTGANPNVLNYEQNLQNRYAAWEQELSDREAVIREKEKELLISD